jgi:hypothetical protein
VENSESLRLPVARQRNFALLLAIATLGLTSVLFYYRQNFSGQIGGKMSVAKLLWLDYAISAWLLVPFFLWRSPLIAPTLRWIYGAHLATFAVRGAVELWMLYITVSWIPPYGITHDLMAITLITSLLWCGRNEINQLNDVTNRTAKWFLSSIRVGLVCEIIFAWLFYRTTEGRVGIYFASPEPVFATINDLTWMAVLLLYPDLVRTLWLGRDALFPVSRFAPTARPVHDQ